jgi:hypothetical protein
LPTAISLRDGITIDKSGLSALIRKINATTVELRGAKGSILSLIFSTTREAATDTASIGRFTKNCTSDIPIDGGKSEFETYFTRLIEAELAACHGTILVSGKNLNLQKIRGMSDAVPVDPALDFYTAFHDYNSTKTAEAIIGLQRSEDLLRGFLKSDGMTVFDTKGRVTAYRVFYQAPKSKSSTQIVGGARRRAFENIKQLVGSELSSVLFRSQDGLTLLHGS